MQQSLALLQEYLLVNTPSTIFETPHEGTELRFAPQKGKKRMNGDIRCEV